MKFDVSMKKQLFTQFNDIIELKAENGFCIWDHQQINCFKINQKYFFFTFADIKNIDTHFFGIIDSSNFSKFYISKNFITTLSLLKFWIKHENEKTIN